MRFFRCNVSRKFALLGIVWCVLCVSHLFLCDVVLAKDTWKQPYKGIRWLHRQTSNQNINVLVIDLCAAGISLRATSSGERKRTVSSFGKAVGAQAAINGDFFSFSNYSTNGMAMHNGSVWPGTKDHGYVTPVAIGKKRIEISHHNKIIKPQSWMKEVVSGHPTLLDDGKHVGNPNDPLCTNRHPRTAIGISKNHKTFLMAVVDGRSSSRIGMTCKDLSTLLKGLGGWDAVNMDGGGSSAMWLRSAGVVSRPSDGSERVVANHLAVKATGSGNAAHCPCQPRCQGSKIHGADCGVGDCAKFGATCVNDRLGVRCASVFCPALGKKKVCVNDKLIGDCDNGGIKTGDCSKFGAYCSTAGVKEARCVAALCVSGPKEIPKAHSICLPDGRFAQCTADGALTGVKACPSKQICRVVAGKAGCISSSFEPPREARPVEKVQEQPIESIASELDGSDDLSDATESTGSNESSFTEVPASVESHGADEPLHEASSKEVYVLVPTKRGDATVGHGCGCNNEANGSWVWWSLLGILLGLLWRRRFSLQQRE